MFPFHKRRLSENDYLHSKKKKKTARDASRAFLSLLSCGAIAIVVVDIVEPVQLSVVVEAMLKEGDVVVVVVDALTWMCLCLLLDS